MRGPYFDHILTSMTLALTLAAPLGAFAQDSNEPAATFKERFPADQTSTRPPLETPDAKKEQNVTTTTRIVSAKRARPDNDSRPRAFRAHNARGRCNVLFFFGVRGLERGAR